MEYLAGLGKHEITCFIEGLGMMGYGQPHNTIKEVATPLWARALVLRHSRGELLVLVHLELAFVSLAVKDALLVELRDQFPDWKLDYQNLLVTAQHTHSGPGGFSHYPLYNFTVPGFRPRVLDTIVTGASRAVQEASRKLFPAALDFGEVTVAPEKEIAFNRSLKAYLNNPGVKISVTKEEAVDRRMRGLLLRDAEGKLKGLLSWFGVHCTSVSSHNNRIHHDNKGVAAELFETNHPGTVAFFLQSSAGDVSPNFIWDRKLKRMRGKFPDQYESAAFNGELQFRESERLTAELSLKGGINFAHSFVDLSREAAPPAHGVAFFKGTLEGPGMPSFLAPGPILLSRLVRSWRLLMAPAKHEDFYKEQNPKDVMLDHRDGSFLGILPSLVRKLPPIPDPILESYRKAAKARSLETLPWVPAIVPFQLVQLGPLLLVTVPGEITVRAGKILEEELLKLGASRGIQKVLVTSYANGYMGYVTTPHEYDLQCYEGGHTVYGRRTFPALLNAVRGLFGKLEGRHDQRPEPIPLHFPTDELARRTL